MKRSPFGDLSADLQALLNGASTQRPFGAGASLVEERGTSGHLHFLAAGWAYRYATTRDGMRQILAVLLPGDFCNPDSLSLPRSEYGARALTPVTLSSVATTSAMKLARQRPELMQLFLRAIAIENAMLGRWALCLGRMSAQARLAHLFCEVAVRLEGLTHGDSYTFDLPLTQEQVADVLGLTPVHVNRTLQNLRAQGLLETRGRTVTIRSMAALAQVGEFDPGYLHRPSVAPSGSDEMDKRSA